MLKEMDLDALLPPRKRLLAGLKRQSCDFNSPVPSTSVISDTRLNNSLKVSIDVPNDDIVETSRSAAIEAVKIAEAARINAEIKAAKAAKAMAAAKIALDLVTTLSEEAAKRVKSVTKCKMKKHITVEALFNKNKGNVLHKTINNSLRSPKQKKLKSSASSSVRNTIQISVEGNSQSTGTVDLNEHVQHSITDQLNYRESEAPSPESMDSCSRKRRKMKQKKLPLSICNLKDDLCLEATQQSEENTVIEAAKSMFTVEGSSTWKCQAFKAHNCVTQNKVMQS